MPIIKQKAKMKKAVAPKKAAPVVQLTSQQKKEIKAQIAAAEHEAYLKGRADEARAQEKVAVAREKAIQMAISKFDKMHQKTIKSATKKSKVAGKKTITAKAKKVENNTTATTASKKNTTKANSTKAKVKPLTPAV